MASIQGSSAELTSAFGLLAPSWEYMVDAAQRSVLFWDVMRQRGNQYREHLAETAPHVLDYEVELVADGRTFERPVNYALVRIIPPAGTKLERTRRPFVVIDPRAGHGPGIGGFKADSEIGVALRSGHPCYFVGFLPEPMPGQTIEDVACAEAVFLQKVIALHPDVDDKPCVIGNCQAGWAVMMLAAIRPELFGPIIVAGSPLSYWAGVRGEHPMRYSGGLVGGSWPVTFMSDIGHGKFDGAWLVRNFENLNPSNTLWSKQYDLYSRIDTEAPRYLGFERWWGGHVNLNAEEIQFIVDDLFVGNNLAAGRIQTSDGMAIDLRNIRSPIVVFCSKGDNITPPSQALGWLLELYKDVDEIRSYGQTIVYAVHETAGHLGIFVSRGVARKEHDELSSNIDLIDTLPPGLYEAVIEGKTDATASADLVSGEWVMRCEARTLDDIRRLGGNNASDDRCFATAARISETNLALYRTVGQPMVRAIANAPMAQWLQELHPLRLQYQAFSDANPLSTGIERAARWVRDHRKPVSSDNPFMVLQQAFSDQIVAMLDGWRDARYAWAEQTFFSIYGSSTLQAFSGVDPGSVRPSRSAAKSRMHHDLLQARISELRSKMGAGGMPAAIVRSLLYAGIPRGGVDERGFEMVRRVRQAHSNMPLSEFKSLVREQFFMLLIDQEAAMESLPAMMPPERETRVKALGLLKQILAARGDISGEVSERLRRIEQLFDVGQAAAGIAPAVRPVTGGKAKKAS